MKIFYFYALDDSIAMGVLLFLADKSKSMYMYTQSHMFYNSFDIFMH